MTPFGPKCNVCSNPVEHCTCTCMFEVNTNKVVTRATKTELELRVKEAAKTYFPEKSLLPDDYQNQYSTPNKLRLERRAVLASVVKRGKTYSVEVAEDCGWFGNIITTTKRHIRDSAVQRAQRHLRELARRGLVYTEGLTPHHEGKMPRKYYKPTSAGLVAFERANWNTQQGLQD